MKSLTLPFAMLFALIAAFLFVTVAKGQSNIAAQNRTPSKEELSKLQASMPSQEELSELLAKADENVSNFENAVRNAKPQLDKIDTKYATNYLDAASTAHLLIGATNKNGPSAYRLIGVLATLDDLSLDAASGSAFLLGADEDRVVSKGAAPDMGTRSDLLTLTAAGKACNDIAELLLHATLRFVNVEEQTLNMLIPKSN
jgi:hypothetical protein